MSALLNVMIILDLARAVITLMLRTHVVRSCVVHLLRVFMRVEAGYAIVCAPVLRCFL